MAGAPDAAAHHLQATLTLAAHGPDPAVPVRTRALLAVMSVWAGEGDGPGAGRRPGSSGR